MPTDQSPRFASRAVATLAILVMATYEIMHTFVQRVPWRGFTQESNRVTYVLLVLFGLAIAGLWSQRAALKPWVALGLLASLAHSVVLAATMNPGWIYFVATAMAAVAAAAAHWPEEWSHAAAPPASVLPLPPTQAAGPGRKLAQG